MSDCRTRFHIKPVHFRAQKFIVCLVNLQAYFKINEPLRGNELKFVKPSAKLPISATLLLLSSSSSSSSSLLLLLN